MTLGNRLCSDIDVAEDLTMGCGQRVGVRGSGKEPWHGQKDGRGEHLSKTS